MTSGVDGDRSAGAVATEDADDPAMPVAADVGDRDAVGDVGARSGCRIDEDRVEHGAPRRVERVHAVGGLDR